MLGEVPILDFHSYDPGRYYWSATLMSLWGDNGIMSLRWTLAIFQAIGLFVGLLLIARAEKIQNSLYLLLSSLTLVVWMYPRYKVFDISISILLIGVLTFLIQNPTRRRYFLTGLCVGLVAVFGRNHGVYGVAGSIGCIAWLSIKRSEGPGLVKRVIIWATGVLVGYMPIFFMALFVPGFAHAYWDSIRFLFESKATNIALPVPWPWRVSFSSMPLRWAIRMVLVGFFFIATALWVVLSIILVVWKKLQNQQVSPALVATSFLALPYAHYAYSRADYEHLAFGIFPLLVGCLVLLATQPAKVKWPLALTLCTVSIWVMFPFHPGWKSHVNKHSWVDIKISRDTLKVDPSIAKTVNLLKMLNKKYAPGERSLVVTPWWPSAYALLNKKSPMLDSYAIIPRNEEFQAEENKRISIADPGFILVVDIPVDGRDELRFHNTHPITNQFIETEFQKSNDQIGNPNYVLYIKKGSLLEQHFN